MRKVTLYIVLLTAIITSYAFADNNDFLKNSIQEILSKKINDDRITVEVSFNSTTKFGSIESKFDNIENISLEKFSPADNSFRAKIIFNNHEEDTISGKYISFISIPVAAKYIKFNDIIQNTDLQNIKIRLDQLKNGYATLASDIVGKKTKNPIKVGEMFRIEDLINPPVIKNGDPVNIVYSSGVINLKTTGIAVGPGAVGESIKVKNDSSGIVVLGEIINKNTVRVGGQE